MIVEAIIIGLITLMLVIANYTVSNVFFQESWDVMNSTIYSIAEGDTTFLTRVDNIFGTIKASYGITLIMIVVAIIAFVYIKSTQREVYTEMI